jgi:hypothetical protein
VNVVVLAPRHQIVAGKARIGAHQDAHLRPVPADLGNDARPHRDIGCGERRGGAFVVTTPDGGTDTGSLTLTDGTFQTTIAVTGNGTYTENLSNWPTAQSPRP